MNQEAVMRKPPSTPLTRGRALAAGLALSAMVGCSSTQSSRSAGDYIDDTIISERVEDALTDHPVYKLEGVRVATYRGTVQLSGFVNTEEQKDNAGQIANDVAGVRDVENNITVKETLRD